MDCSAGKKRRNGGHLKQPVALKPVSRIFHVFPVRIFRVFCCVESHQTLVLLG